MLTRLLEHPLTRGLDVDDPRTTHLRRRILAEKRFGGVSLRGLAPAATYPLWRGFERALSPMAGRLAMFAHVVLERRSA